MENFTEDHAELYQTEDPIPPGRQVSTHTIPFKINDDVYTEADVDVAVHRLRLNKSGSHTHLREYYFKTWLREAYLEEGGSTP